MKSLSIAVMTTLGLTLVACGGSPAAPELSQATTAALTAQRTRLPPPPIDPLTYQVRLDRLRPNAKLLEAGLAFELLDIRDDRCPQDVLCYWAGDATVKIVVRSLSSEVPPRKFELHTTLQPQAVVVDGYVLSLAEVFPYPGSTDPQGIRVVQGAVLSVTAIIR